MAREVVMSVHSDYLCDLGLLIKEMAFEAKEVCKKSPSEFSFGYLAGFHRVVSLMQQQAEAFGISHEELGLSGIDADIDLV